MRLSPFTHQILLLFAGPMVWALHLLAIYGFTGIVCARAGSGARPLGFGWEGWVIVGIGGAAAAVLLACLRAQPRSDDAENRSFLRWTGIALAGLALLAIAWETVPLFLVPFCPQGA